MKEKQGVYSYKIYVRDKEVAEKFQAIIDDYRINVSGMVSDWIEQFVQTYEDEHGEIVVEGGEQNDS